MLKIGPPNRVSCKKVQIEPSSRIHAIKPSDTLTQVTGALVTAIPYTIKSFALYSLVIPALFDTAKVDPSLLHDKAVEPLGYGYAVMRSGPILRASFKVSC